MLKIIFGDCEDAIHNTSMYFDNVYKDKWIVDDFAKEVIKDVDKSQVLDTNLIQSKVLGKIPPTKLSGGTKTLILMYNMPRTIFNASNCGDNCAKWILEIAKKKNIVINLRHFMDFGKKDFDTNVVVVNNKKIVKNQKELLFIACDYLR